MNMAEMLKVGVVAAEAEKTRQVMVKSLQSLLSRGEKMEDLLPRSERLQADSAAFRTSAGAVQRKAWWTSLKWTVGVGAVLCVCAVGVVATLVYRHSASDAREPDTLNPILSHA